jgi:hypothetical protein
LVIQEFDREKRNVKPVVLYRFDVAKDVFYYLTNMFQQSNAANQSQLGLVE